MAKLIITEQGKDKIYEIVDDQFTIGSGAGADLQLRSPEVQGSHLKVSKVRAGYRIVDLETKTGTIVNGNPVNEHVLASGDTIELGDVKITYIGKGPARAGAAGARRKKSGPKLDSSKYYRHARPEKTSSAANAAIICSIILAVFVVGWLMLRGSDVEGDSVSAELRGLIKDSELSDEAYEKLESKVAEYERKRRDLDENQRKTLDRAKEHLASRRETHKQQQAFKEATALWIKISNTSKFEPHNVSAIESLCNEYLTKYSDVSKENVDKVNRILADAKRKTDATPEQKELARVEGEIRRLMSEKELRQAMEALEGMDRTAAAVYPEDVEKLRRKIRMKSRQYLGVRKNEVRFFLREGQGETQMWVPDPAKAREYAVTMIFDKLVMSTIEDYLRSPDKYSTPINQRAEIATQKLLRELVAEYKKK